MGHGSSDGGGAIHKTHHIEYFMNKKCHGSGSRNNNINTREIDSIRHNGDALSSGNQKKVNKNFRRWRFPFTYLVSHCFFFLFQRTPFQLKILINYCSKIVKMNERASGDAWNKRLELWAIE